MAFTAVHKIRFDEVDGAGLLYYPRYFHLCHQVLEESFDARAPLSYSELIQSRRLGLPTVAVEGSFTTPLEYGDTVIITMIVESVGKASIVFTYHMHRESDGAECFTARITTVLTDLDKRESSPIPPELRTVFEGFTSPSDPA